MNIGFITYEYPPDIAQGGIATYVEQAAIVLKDRGHRVEIFCGSPTRTISEEINGIWIHRCKTYGPSQFRADCLQIFSERHKKKAFDIIESPEIHANGLLIKERFPGLPMVVKLHMPLFLQMRLLNFYTSRLSKIRFFLGALRRGRIKRYGSYNKTNDADYKIASLANGIVSPSRSLKSIVSREWEIPGSRIEVIPYPFTASERLLNISTEKNNGKTVSFIGKLNVQKGIVNLIRAIPLVVKKHPDVFFKLIGNDGDYGKEKMKMSDFISMELQGYEKNYSILGGLKYDDVMAELDATSICIFPSIWENFPLVCLEAMSAGRAVIGSKEGGMSEMLDGGAGVIIDPLNIAEMAASITTLLEDEAKMRDLGVRARAKVLSVYNREIIGKKMEEHFQRTMGSAKNRVET